MRQWASWTVVALSLNAVACGATTQSREDGSGNTNWLKECDTDAECGDLSCACGLCRAACDGTTDCSLDPAQSCLSPMSAPSAPAPRSLREHRDETAYAHDMTVADDGTVSLVGGTDATTFDLTLAYPTFWLTQMSEEGAMLGTYREPPAEGQLNTGRSIALLRNDSLITLGTTYDGADTPFLRSFIQPSTVFNSWTASPGFTTLRADGSGGVFATGSRVLDEPNAPRPFTTAWMGRYDAELIRNGTPVLWEQERQGTDGSISNILVASSDANGALVVGGSLGTAADSNASEPYLARLDAAGNFLWEESVHLPEPIHCNATAVALLPDGGSLAAIGCGSRWVRAYEVSGAPRWERRFARGVTALAGLEDGGYVVALSGDAATVQRYDAQHRLIWQASKEGCERVERLAVRNGIVLALAGCSPGYSLSWYGDP